MDKISLYSKVHPDVAGPHFISLRFSLGRCKLIYSLTGIRGCKHNIAERRMPEWFYIEGLFSRHLHHSAISSWLRMTSFSYPYAPKLKAGFATVMIMRGSNQIAIGGHFSVFELLTIGQE